ncbi:MAG TPA: ATP-binding protein [Thermoanaerobaculia bacterium]|nr:ATP-binding protein [Thermoanaerobaculia bacterium]
MSPRPAKPAGRRAGGSLQGRLKVHDPFELIRWLALSQTDPRKALAELVQNSLDAGARTIEVTRERIKGAPCLRVRDNGEGVIPELDRVEALRYIATHVGHSRKRSLTPSERLELMTQGQYGIGLLGFWCLGEALELRTSMPGQKPHRLILTRDRPDYTIEPLRGRIGFDERWTEAVVVGLHREAMAALVAGRAAEYLASELRGQLLQREVALEIHDRMSRGPAQKRVVVRPKRFLGERLDLPARIELAGHPAIQLEVYLRGDETTENGAPGIGVYAAGTLVAEDFRGLASLELDHLPWIDPRLTGLVDFPALQAAPGSRRGVIPDTTAAAFANALREIERDLALVLERFERRRVEALDRAVIRDLQRAFRDFYRQRPRYTMLPVEKKEDVASGPPGHSAASGAGAAGASVAPEAGDGGPSDRAGEQEPPETASEPPSLFPPGPLAEVRIVPSDVRVERGGRREVRARPLDAAGRRVTAEVRYAWILQGRVGRLAGERAAGVSRGGAAEPAGEPGAEPVDPTRAATGRDRDGAGRADGRAARGSAEGRTVVLVAGDVPARGRLLVEATSGARRARAEASVEVLEELPASGHGSDEGIPEPELVDEPAARWRSRMIGGAWQVNSGHPEFRAIADRPGLKLRYLALLFAKEIVLRSTQDPRLESPLEQLVEVAAYADRKLGERRPGRRRKGSGITPATES